MAWLLSWLNHAVEQVTEPKQRIKLFLVFECKLRRSCRFFLCVCNSLNKFLESLEDRALIYSIEVYEGRTASYKVVYSSAVIVFSLWDSLLRE